MIVSDSIEVAKISERWESEPSPELAARSVLFHGSLNQEKFATPFQAFIVDKRASVGCSTSKIAAGLPIRQSGKERQPRGRQAVTDFQKKNP